MSLGRLDRPGCLPSEPSSPCTSVQMQSLAAPGPCPQRCRPPRGYWLPRVMRAVSHVVVLSLGCAAVLGSGGPASAQVPPPEQVESDYKGTVGLGIIGAELGLVIPTALGLQETWSLIAFPIAGAAGGAAAGYYFLDRGVGHPELSVAVLASGMALVIPALILTLSATSHRAEERNAGRPPSSGSFDTSVQAGTSAGASFQQRLRHRAVQLADGGNGTLRWSKRGLRVAPPSLGVLGTYSAEELSRLHLRQQPEFRLSLLSATF